MNRLFNYVKGILKKKTFFIVQREELTPKEEMTLTNLLDTEYYQVIEKYINNKINDLNDSFINNMDPVSAHHMYALAELLQDFKTFEYKPESQPNIYEVDTSIASLTP